MRLTSAPIIANAVTKRFGALTALDQASITLRRGEVSAIVGENGAGKSTLAKIIAGILPADQAAIISNGVPVATWSRREAVGAGIAFVPQNLSFIPTLTIVENHLLAEKGWRLQRKSAAYALGRAAEEMGVSLNLTVPVESLSLAERQMGEIVSAVAGGAKILLLDEPTSSLGPVEVRQLIATIRRLCSGGTTIGLVTHRISEVMEGADHITVLRAGRVVLDGITAGLNSDAIARLMVGDRDRRPPARKPVTSDWKRLEVSGLGVRGESQPILTELSFSVRQGEVLAVAGVSGAMQPALAQCLAGLRKPDAGTIRLDGRDTTGDAARAAASGLAYIQEDRLEGVAPDLANSENASLFRLGQPGFRRFAMRNRAAERALGEAIIADFNVQPPNPDLASGGLSGGNLQKLLVGRELECKPGIIIAHGPTQGLDLAAAASIRTAIVRAAAEGAAVVVISADLDELLEMGHRMIVLANGRITAEFDLDTQVDMTALGQAMIDNKTLETAV
ncbi:sugar ABC transporter ATP-binding protein [Rhizobium sp. B230/85]|uniref:ATP-binding cassette domain-containing protein n=1 Tax=Rhizobium sp. B230/85 TaxID=2819994 RepID=UPI001B20BF88|nr:sugar ABC transporter ATP-binding protein [Rhizobium sp. B230/85]MBO9096679.1 sugar ABC transporter ATP-binding protein [Rhizobium sp. L58/93]MBO9182906.1 sugar ABC transporter ATP-binding protein [Rhizobium sp. E27B/91]QXZ96447.1 sugar ABC transporter ATP-binding protein [Rhizobium sp. B230/85]